VPKCREKLEDGFDVRTQRHLGRNPRLGIREWLEDPAAASNRSFDNAFVDQKENDGSLSSQVDPRPVARPAQIVLEMKADITGGLIEKRANMLVILMRSVMSETPGPGLDQFTAQ
jgi:hypothetical protein